MKLTHYDRVVIHGLGLLARPPIVPQPDDHRLVAGIVAVAAERASREGLMADLVAAVRHVHPDEALHRGTAHHIARALADFDRAALGAHWDAARGVK